MYVPGTLENIKSVIVDIGTGYFAEKVRIFLISHLTQMLKC
jgi:prefoldin subunit 5